MDRLHRSPVPSRRRARELVQQGITGVTSNPTIFSAAIAGGDAYDQQMREVLAAERDPREICPGAGGRATSARRATRCFRSSTSAPSSTSAIGRVTDGYRSRSTQTSLATQGRPRPRRAVCTGRSTGPTCSSRSPGTEPGLQAIEETIAGGIPVNVTLLFSLERHRAAAQAYMRGLRRLRERGGDLRTVASVASFFVSRVDTEADRRLDEWAGTTS